MSIEYIDASLAERTVVHRSKHVPNIGIPIIVYRPKAAEVLHQRENSAQSVAFFVIDVYSSLTGLYFSSMYGLFSPLLARAQP